MLLLGKASDTRSRAISRAYQAIQEGGVSMVEKAANPGPLQIRDALSDEMDEVSAIMLAAYSEYASSLTPAGWELYASNITDVRGRHAYGHRFGERQRRSQRMGCRHGVGESQYAAERQHHGAS